MKRLPTTERGRKSLQKILEASKKVFAEKGFHKTKIYDIAIGAGVAYGLVYSYFNGKKDILIELVKMINHDLRKHLAVRTSGLKDRISIEQEGFKAFFEWFRENKFAYKILREAEIVDEEIYKWHYKKIAEGYSRRLESAMKKGEIRKMDPELLSYTLMGIADFVGKRYILWGDSELDETKLSQLLSALSAMLKP
ncbi:TetR family transcriptional regulator [Candidatus Marsarchaeota G2 archaeon ECH_B_SAG-F08]|jgi:AcrR family transcriptional regulator|uniref:TetR family transcriptional regulator n=5 Tax=Candidatus Marsarchaeota TaxID=1978152 RepID=A0A2R6AI35_9ARCH|nr:MAG: TetR family transcriptional regulator [Candidatus Marsarchaeota G1 archaeon OSP_D]PSN85993.1 MAG: TetR family transcriptional regulator [Candidatus Marsarchaeota G1 archaeon BE_D]PSN87566.1 MAG: TetR family transcriptional regulator [Candidatus Marsarchaeota G1 archaeon OSP_C]PSN90288.1 MAG: TetR family transcriptional regulator [Candidatus Marsarchaeota G1 archaeon OSP_B]PSN98365.1 MAG: TetR family transcriptional regulator [Candidatus Marsarchaeota G2 archaeon ECH_B_SAG-F08]